MVFTINIFDIIIKKHFEIEIIPTKITVSFLLWYWLTCLKQYLFCLFLPYRKAKWYQIFVRMAGQTSRCSPLNYIFDSYGTILDTMIGGG